MGFNKVYKSLVDVFPQIDARALRAVAIEHSKDADAAVEAVLTEIIPFFTERSKPISPSTVGKSSEVGQAEVKNGYTGNVGNQKSVHDADDGHREEKDNTAELTLSKKISENSIKMNVDDGSYRDPFWLIDENERNALQIEVKPVTEETVSADKSPESSVKISSDNISCHGLETLVEDMSVNQNINLIQENEDHVQLEADLDKATNKENDEGKSCADGNNYTFGTDSMTAHDLTTSPLEGSVEVVVPEKLEESLSSDIASKFETRGSIVVTEDESTLNATMSQSSQINIIDVLEEIIADARNNKKTMFSAMQSVITLMKEVELKEKAAEQAKVEAAMGGADILVKVEELKQMLQHAKEANGMHAGEVYGEKAVLATELRELQYRVLSLSDERDKSLTVLNEMRQALEVQLSAAENEIKLAEQEKLEKEKAAAKTLADHELIMEKVVQESKILKQQAEDNAKLQEFLVDRGRIVDILQGEIGVICLDVRMLKEKFDEHVPFSKSLSSSQTSFTLASAPSSLIPEQVPSEAKATAVDPLETREKSRLEEQSSEEESAAAIDDDRKALLDDGWEFFDNREIYG